jgi:hypothetical protein
MYGGGVLPLVSGAPAIALGLAAGLVVVRRGWTVTPALIAGALAFAVLVAYRRSGPALVGPEGNGSMTAPLWGVLTAVNAGCWCLGLGMGVALAGIRRTSHPR